MAGTIAQFSASMMENHIPAAVLDATNGFSAVVGSDGSQFVLSIGDDNIFRISSDANCGCSTWTTQDAAAALLTQIGSGAVAYFAIGYSPTTDTITIAIVVSDIAGSGDQLWVAAGLSASVDAAWMTGGITWTEVPFDSAAYSTITAANLNVSAITLMLTEEDYASETPLAFVTAIDPSNSNFRVFSVVIPPGVVQTGDTAWNNFVLPTDSNETLTIAAGQPYAPWGQGLYALGTSTAGGPVLDFIPFQYDGEAQLTYTAPAGATAIASLVLPDLSQDAGATLTDLYVAGSGSLTVMPQGKVASNAIDLISGSNYIVGTTQLHVLTNYGATGVTDSDALIIVWGVNQPTEAGVLPQVFYSYALYNSRYSPPAWSPVVVLMAQAQAVAPVLNSAVGSVGFFGITSSPIYTTNAYKTPPAVLVGMQSDPTTLTWQNSYLPIPTTGDYIRLQSYTSQIKVIDPTTSLPQSNVSLSITTASDTTLIINGVAVDCPAATAVAQTTDAAGLLTIINPVSGISAVPFSVSDSSGDPVSLLVNGTAVTQPYDPTGTVTATLTAGINGDLSVPQCQASNAPPPGTYALVAAPSSTNATTASGAFQAITTNMPSASAGALRAQRGNAIDARVRLARLRAEAAASGSELGDGNGLTILFGDLAQWLVSAVEDVADVVVNAVEEGFQLVVTFASGTFNAIVTSVEEAWTAVVAVFQWIGATFDDVFRWLAFIFNWNEMLAVHTALSTAFSSGFSSFTSNLANAQSAIDTWFQTTEASLSGNTFSAATGSIQASATSNAPSSPVVNGTNLSSDPRIGWVGSQLKNMQQASAQAKAPVRAAAAGDSGNMCDGFSTFGTSLLSTQNQQSASLTQLGSSANGNGDIGSAVAGFVDDIGSDMLTGMQSAVDAGFQLVEAAATDAETMLTQTITIPVLSGIYYDFVGTEPSLQDIICLCAGVVVTVTYNLVGEGNLPDLQTYVQGSTFQGYFGGFTIASKPAATLRRRIGDSLDPAAGGIVGGLAILQGFAIAADYMGEQSEVVDVVALAAIVETVCDFLSCCIAAGSGGVDPDYADFKELGAGLRLVVLIGLLQAGARQYFGCTEQLEIAEMGEGVATGLGLWALVDILTNVDAASGLDWLDMFVDLLALPSALLTEADAVPYAPIVAVLRMFMAEGLGIGFINDAVSA